MLLKRRCHHKWLFHNGQKREGKEDSLGHLIGYPATPANALFMILVDKEYVVYIFGKHFLPTSGDHQ
jgi:hypothetical protein